MPQRITESTAVYQRLQQLRIGSVVPEEVYIEDRDGLIPRWVVIKREEVPGGGLRLLAEEQTSELLRLGVATRAVSLPLRSILASPHQIRSALMYPGEKGWPRRSPDDLLALACLANQQEQARAEAP